MNRLNPGVRILVVDDEPDTAKTLTQLLAALGYSSQAITNAAIAVQGVRDFQPHVMILDIAMPGQNGYEVMRQVRADPSTKHTVIVVASGFCQEADRSRAFEAGADHFLAKPLSLEKLREIAQVAAERAAPRE